MWCPGCGAPAALVHILVKWNKLTFNFKLHVNLEPWFRSRRVQMLLKWLLCPGLGSPSVPYNGSMSQCHVSVLVSRHQWSRDFARPLEVRKFALCLDPPAFLFFRPRMSSIWFAVAISDCSCSTSGSLACIHCWRLLCNPWKVSTSAVQIKVFKTCIPEECRAIVTAQFYM